MDLSELRVQKACRIEHLQNVERTEAILLDHAQAVMNKQPVATERLTVLLGAALKLVESTRAILRLGEIEAADEMHVLLRTEVELLVNACYLQYASDDELARFLHHDAINGYVALGDVAKANVEHTIPQDLVARVTSYASDASQASGLPLTSRNWNVETRTLKQRADIVDKNTGRTDCAAILASMYVTGSGYTHAAWKTLHKHAHYLTTGKRQHSLASMFSGNNAIQGAGYVLHIFIRYLGGRFGLSTREADELGVDSTRVLEIARADYALFRNAEKAQDKT